MTFELKFCGLLVKYEYSPGSPGQLYGPPENCYPPEPADVCVISWRFDNPQEFHDETGIFPLRKLVALYLNKANIADTLTEEMILAGEDEEMARYETAMEDRAEAQTEDWYGEDLHPYWEPEY